MFDMRNYGDLLFPVIAKYRLKEFGYSVIPYAPSNASPGLEVTTPRAIDELIRENDKVDGVIIGGGYIIHNQPISKLLNYTNSKEYDNAVSSTWLGATLSACLADVPLVWNAPGVPFPFPKQHLPYVKETISAASYLSVRDKGSANLLPAPNNGKVSIIPDPIAELSRIWLKEDLSSSFANFQQRYAATQNKPILAMHIRDRSLSGIGPEKLANLIDAFTKKSQHIPILIALGEAHDDLGTAQAVSAYMKEAHVVYDDPVNLQEITSVIAHARMYIGASLHGYIVASSYAIPSVLIARPSYNKFKGYLDHIGMTKDLMLNWYTAFERAAVLLGESSQCPLPESVFQMLDTHWSNIRDALANPQDYAKQRQGFLAAMLRQGIVLEGTSWPLMPFRLNRNSTGK